MEQGSGQGVPARLGGPRVARPCGEVSPRWTCVAGPVLYIWGQLSKAPPAGAYRRGALL